MTSPRAAGAPNSARAVNSAAARTMGDRVSPRDPNGVGACARARRMCRTDAAARYLPLEAVFVNCFRDREQRSRGLKSVRPGHSARLLREEALPRKKA